VGLAAASAHLAARRLAAAPARAAAHELRRILSTTFLLLLFRATVAVPPATYLQLEVLLAALRLSLLAMRDLADPRDHGAWTTFLAAMALLVCGWCTLAFSLHRLEWHVFYRLADAAFVERHVALFVPAIVARYVIPAALGWRIITEASPAPGPSPWGPAAALALKIVTLVPIVFGHALFDPANEGLVEAAQTLIVLVPLALAVALLRLAPRPGRPTISS
jgi:hypothetical protein